jgi:hypothetical protein
MLKAGGIAAAIMFVVVLVLSAGLSPFCALCVPLVTGLLAGYLTGTFEKNPQTVIRRGAGAGAIAGAAAILAQMAASVINGLVLQNPDYQLNRALGVPATEPTMVWALQLGLACFVGSVNVALTAGLGALGGAIWKGTAGKATARAGPTGT